MSRRALLLSRDVPPATTGSAVIVGNLVKQFRRDEMIVAGERPIGRPPVSWRAEWPEISYVAIGYPLTWRGVRWWRLIQLPMTFLKILYLARRHRCSAIITVFPTGIYLFAGYLAATFSGARLFPYLHNTFVENRRGVVKRIATVAQKLIFARSEHVFVISDGMLDLYRARYPGLKCSALVHSFGEIIPTGDALPRLKKPTDFLICGSINESCRDATERVCEALRQAKDARLTFLTGTPKAHLSRRGLLRAGVDYETVSRDEVVGKLRTADIVILPHGFVGAEAPEEYETIFPTRTIEYLICGRPILAHSPDSSYLTRFLRQHECALVVDEPSVSRLVEAIERLRSDSRLREALVGHALKAAEQFRATRVAHALRSHLDLG